MAILRPLLKRWQSTRDRSNAPSFQYAELESPTHTRVIELSPSGQDKRGPLRCQIHQIDLKQLTIKYTALSYAWGEPSVRTRFIECQGSNIFITPNLFSALVRLRHESESRMIWVDALSIQQGQDPSSLKEKNAQIRLMTDIFRQASLTIVDLGVYGAEDVLIVRNVAKYNAISDDQWKDMSAKVNDNVYREPWQEPETTKDIFEAHQLPEFQDKFWLTLSNFINRSWFDRLWVIQEYAISSHVQMLIGEELVESDFGEGCRRALLHHLYMASRLPISYRKLITSAMLGVLPKVHSMLKIQDRDSAVLRSLAMTTRFSDTFVVMKTTASTWRSVMNPDGEINNEKAIAAGLNLCMMLYMTMQFKVTDNRDRVYALLGLLGDKNDPALYIDYLEPLEQLSMRVSHLHIKRSFGAVSLLHHCVGASSPGPSWVFELTRNSRDVFVYALFEQATRKIFDCGGIGMQLPLKSTDRAGIVSVQAIILGHIRNQTDPPPFLLTRPDLDAAQMQKAVSKAPATFSWLVDVFSWIAYFQKNVNPDTLSLKTEPLTISCYKTLLTDCCGTDEGTGSPKYTRLSESPVRAAYLLESMASFKDLLSPSVSVLDAYTATRTQRQAINEWMRSLQLGGGRHLGIIDTGPCLIPAEAKLHDVVAVFLGFPFPFVIRAAEDDTYRIVGTCYAHGMMDGQALTIFASEVKELFLS